MNLMKDKGFTLIEVICTISIIVILSSIAIPVSLSQIREATDRKCLIEEKLIENAVDIHNFESPDNMIREGETLSKIKIQLMGNGKQYLESWPPKLKIIRDSRVIEVNNENLSLYNFMELKQYIKEQEENLGG